jgi:hypothetical protein
MKATELRIGNLIFNTVGGINTPIIADIISIKYAHTYEPIPLTEEWLDKFGLREIHERNGVKYSRWASKKGITLYESSGGYSCYKFSNKIIIHFVHQLQNLYFILTGEELKTNS